MFFEKNKSLKGLNTFGIDAKASFFAEYGSTEDLFSIIAECTKLREQNSLCRILHIGAGSNLLFLKDFDGVILHNAIKTIEVVEETADDVLIRVGGGVVFDELVKYSLGKGWFGLENLSIIPGEVGASAVQNIGAYGVEAKDFITHIELVDLITSECRKITNAEANYSYRYSVLKSPEMWGRYAVSYVCFRLGKRFVPKLEYGGLKKAFVEYSPAEDSMSAAMRLRDVIIEMRQSKLPDPKLLGNAGSFFMNPIIKRSQFAELQANYPSMPCYEVSSDLVKVPAGWLIEQAGWKGRTLGKAGVYEKQALVLVNLGNATGKDIVVLSDTVRNAVKEKFGIDIRPEVNFI